MDKDYKQLYELEKSNNYILNSKLQKERKDNQKIILELKKKVKELEDKIYKLENKQLSMEEYNE